jgi:hypothetical protein
LEILGVTTEQRADIAKRQSFLRTAIDIDNGSS